MKAAIIKEWGSPDVFKHEEIETPKPEANQIRIKVFCTSINPVDWKQRKGNHRYILGAPFPIVLGYDVCGEVVETGSDISSFKPGDIVLGDLDNKYGGALAEFAIAHEECFAKKPENLTNEEAAAIPLAGLTAMQALRDKGNIKKGQTVVINGASGGVGHIAIQIAKAFGAKTIAVAGSRSKEFVKQYSPDQFFDYTKDDILKADIKADIFFDVAGTQSYVKTRHMLNKRGIYISTLPRLKILLHKLLQPFSNGKKVKTLLRKQNSEDLKTLANMLQEGKVKVHIDKVFSIKDINQAHEYAQQSKPKGKIVVSINS